MKKENSYCKKIILVILIFIFVTCSNNENKLLKILKTNKVIFEYGFARNSFDIYEQKNKLLIRRTIFGSGIPVIGTVTYRIDKIKNTFVSFHEVYQADDNLKNFINNRKENFIIQFGKNNKIELIVNDKIYLETGRTKN